MNERRTPPLSRIESLLPSSETEHWKRRPWLLSFRTQSLIRCRRRMQLCGMRFVEQKKLREAYYHPPESHHATRGPQADSESPRVGGGPPGALGQKPPKEPS